MEFGRRLARPYGLYRYLYHVNRQKQEAAIFLSNRTYEKDERAQWILDRNQVMDLIRKEE